MEAKREPRRTPGGALLPQDLCLVGGYGLCQSQQPGKKSARFLRRALQSQTLRLSVYNHTQMPATLITSVDSLCSARNSTSRRALRSARAVDPVPLSDTAPQSRARDARPSRPRGSRGGAQVPFFEFFHDRMCADMQHTRRVTDATG